MTLTDESEVARMSAVFYLAEVLRFFEHHHHMLEKSLAKGDAESAEGYLVMLHGVKVELGQAMNYITRRTETVTSKLRSNEYGPND